MLAIIFFTSELIYDICLLEWGNRRGVVVFAGKAFDGGGFIVYNQFQLVIVINASHVAIHYVFHNSFVGFVGVRELVSIKYIVSSAGVR